MTTTTFDPSDFRKVGTVAEFDPQWLSAAQAKSFGDIPVRVVKVNPKTIVVETPNGQRITTDAWMLVPTDKPFVEGKPAPVLGQIVRVRGRGSALYVVIEARVGKVKVALLGGDGNRYLSVKNVDALDSVDPVDVLLR